MTGPQDQPPQQSAEPGSQPLVTSGITAGPGGVMTVEVGVITGDLTLRTTWDGHQALLDVQYDGADEWYTVEASPLPALDVASVLAIHEAMTQAVRHGGGTGAQKLA